MHSARKTLSLGVDLYISFTSTSVCRWQSDLFTFCSFSHFIICYFMCVWQIQKSHCQNGDMWIEMIVSWNKQPTEQHCYKRYKRYRPQARKGRCWRSWQRIKKILVSFRRSSEQLSNLQKDFDDYKQCSAPAWEKEMKQRDSKFSGFIQLFLYSYWIGIVKCSLNLVPKL